MSNIDVKSKSFKNEWLHFCLYFVQFMYKTKKRQRNNKVCDFITAKDRLKDNGQPLGANKNNTVFLGKPIGDSNNGFKTAFFKLEKKDLLTIEKFYGRASNNLTPKRVKSDLFGINQIPQLLGTYLSNGVNYFYKGLYNSNIVDIIFRYFS